MNIALNSTIPITLDNIRLDQALARLFPQYSRARLQSWVHNQQVTVDGALLRSKDKVRCGQQVEVNAQIQAETRWQAETLPLDIIYEDQAIIVINKPAGLVVHPATGNPAHTLVNALLHHAPELATLPRAGIVHRLDKDTSGIMVVARSLTAHTQLVTQLQARTVQRLYVAIVRGVPISGGTVDAAIGRHPQRRTYMAVVTNGKPAISHYRVVERFRHHSLLHVTLETGRTHQIRVHMTHVGYPLIGDQQYGGRFMLPPGGTVQLNDTLRGFKRQALHAHRLTLAHPDSAVTMSWEAPLPEDIITLREALRADK